MAEESHYEVLGLCEDASAEEVNAAYRRLVRQVHPDAGGTSSLFRRVQEAYDTLSDPNRRAAYDRDRRSPRGTSSTESGEATADDGWVRVDRPNDYDARGEGPKRQAPKDQEDTRDPWRGSRGAPGGPEGPNPNRTGPHPDSEGAAQGRGVLGGPSTDGGGLLRRHPWIWLFVAAVVLFRLAPAIGLLLIVVGFVAAVGDMRVRRREDRQWVANSQVAAMDGYQFEQYVAELFRATGAWVRQVGREDCGVDLLVARDARRLVVQAKRSSYPVGAQAVEQAAAAKMHYKAEAAMVVTDAVFTPRARQLARSTQVILWDGTALVRLAESAGAVSEQSGAFGRLGSQVAAGAGILAIVAGLAGVAALVSALNPRRGRGRGKS